MVTDNAHLLALNRFTGELLWETEMADWHQNYNATSAPLAVGSLVISGTAGGEQGARGFVAAYDQATGKEAGASGRCRAGRAGFGDLEGQGHRHPGCGDLVYRHLRSATGYALLADRQSRARITTATSARATISIPARSWRWTPRPASSNGITSSRRTTSGTGMPPSRRCWWTPTGRASRANCCCTPTATASSMCSTGPTANCCWPSRS